MPETNLKLRAICGSRTLSFAPKDTKWKASEAETRVKEHAEATDGPNTAYSKAFTVVSGDNDEFGSYHLPFADVVGGELKAVWGAIKAIAEILQGARGGVELSDKDRSGAKRFVEAYYAKAASIFDDDTIKVPWAEDEDNEGKSAAGIPLFKGQYLGKYTEYSMAMSAIPQASYALHDEIGDALTGYGDYKDMSDAECNDRLGSAFDEHKDLCMSVIGALKSGKGAESASDAAKSMQKHALAVISTVGLGSGLSWEKHAEVAGTVTRMITERASEQSRARNSDDRKLSQQKRAILRSLCDQLNEFVAEMEDVYTKSAPPPSEDAADALLRDEVLRVNAESAMALSY